MFCLCFAKLFIMLLQIFTSLSLLSIRGVISDTITLIPGNLLSILLIMVNSFMHTFLPSMSSISLTPVCIIMDPRDEKLKLSMKSSRVFRSPQFLQRQFALDQRRWGLTNLKLESCRNTVSTSFRREVVSCTVTTPVVLTNCCWVGLLGCWDRLAVSCLFCFSWCVLACFRHSFIIPSSCCCCSTFCLCFCFSCCWCCSNCF